MEEREHTMTRGWENAEDAVYANGADAAPHHTRRAACNVPRAIVIVGFVIVVLYDQRIAAGLVSTAPHHNDIGAERPARTWRAQSQQQPQE